MRRIVFSVMAFALAGVSAAEANTPTRSPTDYSAVFETVLKTVDEHFYDPGFRGHDWRAIGDRTRVRLATVSDDKAFQSLVTGMLNQLQTSHLAFTPPRASSASGAGIGARLAVVDGEQTVLETGVMSDARRKGLRPGDRMESDVLRGPVGTVATVRVKACNGQSRTLQIRRERAFWPPPKPSIAWSTIEAAPGKTLGYLRIDRFDDGQAEMTDRAMADLKDTEGLVIDVRDNSGGNVSALRLASYLTEGEGPAVAVLARPWLVKLGRPVTKADVVSGPKISGVYTTEGVMKSVGGNGGGAVFWTEDLAAQRYTRPVVVLISDETGSAAEGFAWIAKLKTKARLIGRRTPGVLLSGETFEVGDGWRLTIPTSGLWGPDGQDFGDKGVDPHEVVPFTRADLCAGRDPDIERAVAILGG